MATSLSVASTMFLSPLGLRPEWSMALYDFRHVAHRRGDCFRDRRARGLQLVAHRGVAERFTDGGESRVERVSELVERIVHLLALGLTERRVRVEAILQRSPELAEALSDLVPLLLG